MKKLAIIFVGILLIIGIGTVSGCSPLRHSGDTAATPARTSTPLPVPPVSPTPDPLASISVQLSQLANRLTALESITSSSTVPKLQQQLSDLQGQVTNAQSQISGIQAQLRATPAPTPKPSTPSPTPDPALVSLQSVVTALDAKVTTLQTTASEIALIATNADIGAPSYIANINSALILNSPGKWVAQIVYCTSPGTFAGFNALFTRAGGPGAVTFQLVGTRYDAATGQYSPTIGNVLSTGSLGSTGLGASYSWYNIAMTAYKMENGKYYALVAYSSVADASNYISIAADGLNPTYLYGRAWFSTNYGSSWAAVNPSTDMIFNMVY